MNVDPALLSKVLSFVYHGQVLVSYDEMEGFLQTCKQLRMRLFKEEGVNAEGQRDQEKDEEDVINNQYQER